RLGRREHADYVRQDRSPGGRRTVAALVAFVAGIVRIGPGPEFPAGDGDEVAGQHTKRGPASLRRSDRSGLRPGLGLAAGPNKRRKSRRTGDAKCGAAARRGEWQRIAEFAGSLGGLRLYAISCLSQLIST